ncbi:hypothetical protein M2263_003638 [Providencia alcalifaciens]|nr:hypothetical protein [Providencia alcalifaciens]
MYTLNEGQFIAPPSTWKDTSMNVFRDPNSPRTLIVARSEMTQDHSLEEELTLQCEQLQQVATNITISPFETVKLPTSQQAEALEANITFYRSGGQFYQRQLAVLQKDKHHILLFSYTSATPFEPSDEDYWLKLKDSLTITA